SESHAGERNAKCGSEKSTDEFLETHTCSSKLKCTEENPSTLIIIHVGACTMIVFWTSAGRPCGGLFSIFNRRLADGLNMPGADAESAELQPAADSRQPYRERRSQMEIQGGRGEDAQCEAGESEI